jgi:hypothetical protein
LTTYAGGMAAQLDRDDLIAMLEGYVARGQRVQQQINALTKRLGGRRAAFVFSGASGASSEAPRPRTTHRISAAGRKRIADAQRRRWAATKAENKPEAAAVKSKKRQLSPSVRKALLANLERARAAKRTATVQSAAG